MADPKLRFKYDNGNAYPAWRECILDDILTERNESHVITEDAPQLSFTIEQGVIYPEDKKTNKRDFLMKDKDNKKFLLTEYNDIIYNPANLKFGAIHRNTLGRGVVSPIYAIFYTDQDPAFIEGIVTNPKFIKSSLKYLEGTVIKLMTLKPRDFIKMKVWIPCLEEQQKIAGFLLSIDEVIAASEQEVTNLETQKKAVMKKIFSQEVRFKREDGTDFSKWDVKFLDEVVVFLDGMRKPIEARDRVAGSYPYYGASGITDYVEDYIFDEDLILLSEDGANILDRNYRVCFMARGKYWVNNHAHVLRANKDCVNEYICEYLESLDYSRMNSGSAQPKLNQQTCRKIPVMKPCLEEQRLIANFLSDFDEAIAAAKKELELWKELKKGLLQQMFV